MKYPVDFASLSNTINAVQDREVQAYEGDERVG